VGIIAAVAAAPVRARFLQKKCLLHAAHLLHELLHILRGIC
jgi:hypothetical protein